MINHGKVRSTIKPESIKIDEYSVWVSEDIKEIQVEDELEMSEVKTKKKSTHTEYEYNLTQYDKNEYILQEAQQITDTELALCEIYESLGV